MPKLALSLRRQLSSWRNANSSRRESPRGASVYEHRDHTGFERSEGPEHYLGLTFSADAPRTSPAESYIDAVRLGTCRPSGFAAEHPAHYPRNHDADYAAPLRNAVGADDHLKVREQSDDVDDHCQREDSRRDPRERS